MKKTILISFLALIALEGYGQSNSSKVWPNGDAKRWSLSLLGGTTTFTGDARKPEFGYMGGLGLQYNFSHSFGIRALGSIGRLQGQEKPEERPFASYSFTNNFWDAQGQVVFSLGNISFLRKARKLNLYTALGAGYFNNDATSEFVNKQDPLVTRRDTFSGGVLALSGSAGFRYKLGNFGSLGLEYNLRAVNSDKVDLLDYQSHANKSRDVVHMASVNLSFFLGKKGNSHLEFINPVETVYENITKLQKNVEELKGDADGDGVADYFDKDNNTPAGANVYGNGKAVDTDGDGIPDIHDAEPFSPAGAKTDLNGKAIDSDGDGVPDVLDMSPDTDTSFLVNHQGIPIMTKELARRIAPGGSASKSGSRGGSGFGNIGYLPAILFETNSFQVKPTYFNDLQSVAEAIRRIPGIKVEIIGNADSRGENNMNYKLAMRRAETVKKILVETFGVDGSLLSIKSNGSKVPIARGNDPFSLQANRRVQFFIVE